MMISRATWRCFTSQNGSFCMVGFWPKNMEIWMDTVMIMTRNQPYAVNYLLLGRWTHKKTTLQTGWWSPIDGFWGWVETWDPKHPATWTSKNPQLLLTLDRCWPIFRVPKSGRMRPICVPQRVLSYVAMATSDSFGFPTVTRSTF